MIAESLVAFINASAGARIGTQDVGYGFGGYGDGGYGGVESFPYLLKDFGLVAYVMTPETVLSDIAMPFCLVDYLNEPAQDLWVVGDAQRKENVQMSVGFYCQSYVLARDLTNRFRNAIESVKMFDVGDRLHPGIDFLACADVMRNNGDNQTYLSDQPNWFQYPAPTIFKNRDSNGEPIPITSGFTIDSVDGRVLFSSANLVTDEIRATYKIGLVDFNIAGVSRPQEVDVENNPSRFMATFDLATHFYIKTNANRFL